MPVREHLERGQASRYMGSVEQQQQQHNEQHHQLRPGQFPVTDSSPESADKRGRGEAKTRKREGKGYPSALLPGLNQPLRSTHRARLSTRPGIPSSQSYSWAEPAMIQSAVRPAGMGGLICVRA